MQAVNAAKKGDTVYAIKDIDPALFQYGFTRVNKNGITINMQNHSYNGQISAACDYDLDKNNNVVSTPVTLNVYNLKGNEDTILTSEEECTLNLYNLQLGANQQYSFESFADNDNKGKINIYSGNLKGVLSFGENVVVTIMGGTYNLSTVYFNETATISVRAGKFSSYSYNTLKKYLTKYTKTAVNKDGTYTCTYVNTYGISFRGNGATSGSTAAMKGVLADRSISLRANGYKRTDYTFVGWNTLSNGKGKTYKNKASIKNLTAAGKTITLYAIWKPVTYKLSYKLNGGKNSSKNVSSYKITSSTITLKTPTRKGYTFKGWYSDSKCTKRVKTIKKGSTGNRTLYAKWSVKTYSIKYRLNGGKNSSRNPKSYKITTKSITLKTPTRKGYKFKGWYSNSKLTKRVKTIRKGSTGTRYLYAKWAKA